jgi:hypothetical protein
MTPEQVELIRNSFDAMWPIQLRARPDAKEFRGDMERQRIKLMGMIAAQATVSGRCACDLARHRPASVGLGDNRAKDEEIRDHVDRSNFYRGCWLQ